MERKKRKEGSGIYIAICCCVVIIAIVGYANRISLKDEAEENKVVQNVEPVQTPAAVQEPAKEAEEAKVKPTDKPKAAEEPAAVSKNVQVEEEIQFNAPVKGKVVEEYSGDDLVYNEALKDWRAHSGVDFAAELGEQVVCSARGIVEKVFDSNMGRCVIVDHQNGFKTMYANLNENTAVKEGDEVAQGDVVGTVGSTALGDSTDEPHLHFEMTSNDKNVNPVEYLE